MKKNSKKQTFKHFKRRITFYLYYIFAFPLLWVILRIYPRLIHWSCTGDEPVKQYLRSTTPLVFAFWHSDILGMLWYGPQRVPAGDIHVLISPSRDGLFIARLVRSLGLKTIVGSSASKSLSGLRNMLECLKTGGKAAVAVDGPRGPRHEVKSGSLFLARYTGTTLVPVIIHYEKKWLVKSWDIMEIPKPFTKSIVQLLDPIEIPTDLPNDQLMGCVREKLQAAMQHAKQTPPFFTS